MTRRLPPEVETAITAFRVDVEAATLDGDRFWSDFNLGFVEEALRTAILAACDAAERRGIERAAAEADRIGEGYAALREATLDEDHLVRYWAAHAVATTIRALPVPEEGA